MTPEQLEQIKARAAKATAGPWRVHSVDDTCVTSADHARLRVELAETRTAAAGYLRAWRNLDRQGNWQMKAAIKATDTLTSRIAELEKENAARVERLEAERDLLREAVDRYGDKGRMAWCSRHELQQVIDDAIAARRVMENSHE